MVVGVFFGGLASAFADPRTRGLVVLTAAVVLIASVFYSLVEGWSFLDAMFFSVATISTVGYGDMVPQTRPGRIFTIAFIFVGIGVFVVTAASIANHVIRRGRAVILKDDPEDETRD
jgi:voltage-gated potassium channel Kch